jgi:hypothetical protein
MQTKSYSDLLALAQALIGAGSLTYEEQDQVLQFVNRRAHEAYQTSESWPRYMVANEPRTIVADQTVPYSEDSFYVFGAGTSEANGLYVRNGDDNGKGRWTLFNADEISLFDIQWDDEKFILRRGAFYNGTDSEGEVLYNSPVSAVDAPLESGWSAQSGEDPAPTVVDLPSISEFIRIHRTQPFVNRSALEYDFYTTARGAHIMNIRGGEASVAYVTYKKEFTPFTASSTDIPQEWFYFIAHGAYADFLRVQNKQQEALAEEQIAATYLALELEKIDNRVNNTNLVNRFSTYVNRQSR